MNNKSQSTLLLNLFLYNQTKFCSKELHITLIFYRLRPKKFKKIFKKWKNFLQKLKKKNTIIFQPDEQ